MTPVADMPTIEPDETSGVMPPPYGPNNEKLPKQIQNALRELIKKFHNQEKFDRRREVLRDRKNRFYERGQQHVYSSGGGFYAQMTAGGTVSTATGAEVAAPNKIDDYNIFQPYLRINVSILTQNNPGVKFEPDNPNLIEDVEASETAEHYRELFDRTNDVHRLQVQIVRMFGLSGRTVVWTRTEANGEKWGFNPDGSPKRMEVSEVFGTLETKVPIMAKSQEQAMYCFIVEDLDVKQAKEQHPEFKDKIQAGASGVGESAYERMARLGVLHGSRTQAQVGDAMTHIVARTNAFLRPAAFAEDDDGMEKELEEMDEFAMGVGATTVGDACKALYPTGCLARFVGDTYVGSRSVSMDDEVVIGFPNEGDGMFRMAFMDPMVCVQDRFNDNMNAAAEIFDFGWPSRWVNADQAEYDAIREQKADPYAIRQKQGVPSGGRLEDQFYQEPDPQLPPSFMQFTEMLQGPLAQFILAAPPALFGDAMKDQKTASGYAQARAQAMGQQSLMWGELQRMFARIRYQAALCAANNPDHAEEIVVPGGKGRTTLRLERLKKGKFGTFPDEDSSFPESTGAKRTTMMQIVEMASQSPDGQQLFQSPDFWGTFSRLNGFPELKVPAAASRNKQQLEIEQLLLQNPLMPTPDEVAQAETQHAAAQTAVVATGGMPGQFQPPAPKPSIDVDPLDFHLWEFEYGREWLSGPQCTAQLAQGNYAGVTNVRLHVMRHLAMAPLMPPPPGTMVPPPPGQVPAPKGAQNPNRAIETPSPGAPGAATM